MKLKYFIAVILLSVLSINVYSQDAYKSKKYFGAKGTKTAGKSVERAKRSVAKADALIEQAEIKAAKTEEEVKEKSTLSKKIAKQSASIKTQVPANNK